ncbi:mediator of RNA polymerase II transcription subunit 6-like isoform X4 [Hylaeus volcanicus]|uniref:mediator of RNA polymerase II transcription subunit 6-like isoform X4 n=1 Tax=Hylaeus volcanicus TaxID=313075 RepID=UPI0023B84C56|nr:mediator of RNA polymerase II transcription subunit 6-like isoform X4 [Hylaeus volcanicus]
MVSINDFEKFRDDIFLARHVLNELNVMEYFYSSQFFDTSSLNQKQRRGSKLTNTEEGILYRLMYVKDTITDKMTSGDVHWNSTNQLSLFIIQKFVRDPKQTETPLECFYILGGTIYKSPFLGTLVRRCCFEAIEKLDVILNSVTNRASWSLIEGYSWETPSASTESSTKELHASPQSVSFPHSTVAEETNIENLYAKKSCDELAYILETSFRTVHQAAAKLKNDREQNRINETNETKNT